MFRAVRWLFCSCGEPGLLSRCGAQASRGGFSCCGAQALGIAGSVGVACGLSSGGLQPLECRMSSCVAQAYLLHDMWGLPGPRIGPMYPVLPGRLPTLDHQLLSHFSRVRLCAKPIDGSPPGSPVPGILKARTLEWAAISFSDA